MSAGKAPNTVRQSYLEGVWVGTQHSELGTCSIINSPNCSLGTVEIWIVLKLISQICCIYAYFYISNIASEVIHTKMLLFNCKISALPFLF